MESLWPTHVPYLERLAPDASGNPTLIQVEQPLTRADAFDLVATIDRLAREGNFAEWQSLVRMYTATSYYVTNLFLSGGQRLDPFTGRIEADCDFLWHHLHEIQHEGEGKINTSFRGSFKSHGTIYVGATCKVVVNPNRVMAICSHQKDAAAKHGIRLMLEWERNVELKAAWPDVFFADPKKDPDCPLWNQETGCTVRRTIPSILPTLSWWAIEHVPTGARISDFFFTDLETEDTVESDDQRTKLLRRFSSFKKTAGRVVSIWIEATAHHANGLVAHLRKSQAYGSICHTAEDLEHPELAPDIAALYDECGGKITNRETGEVKELPAAVRDIRLDGPAVFHHPLELAMMRLDALDVPGGLDDYRRQMLDDLFGSEKRLDVNWIRYYDCRPEEIAEGAFLYITVDPSKGVGDPTFARVEACRSDRSIAWVGGLRKRIPPSDFGKEIWLLGCLWEGIGVIKEFRFEEVAQSTWVAHFIQYCELRRHWPGNIGPANVKEIGGRAINWGGRAWTETYARVVAPRTDVSERQTAVPARRCDVDRG